MRGIFKKYLLNIPMEAGFNNTESEIEIAKTYQIITENTVTNDTYAKGVIDIINIKFNK